MRTKVSLLSVLVMAALAGCGGGGGGSSPATSSAGSVQAVQFTTGQSAAVVLGQPDFTSSSANQGGTANANTLSTLYGDPAVLNGALYLPDYGNNRVLGFNHIPNSNDPAADFVLGQTTFTGSASGNTLLTMYHPQQVVAYGGALYVDEFSNNRIDVYNTAPTAATSAPAAASPMPISFVLTASAVGGFNAVESFAVGGGKLVVTDSSNNRVLIWNTVPTSDTPPNLVLGQTSFTGVSINQGGSPTGATLYYPAGVWTDGQRLVVLDEANNRVLIWNTFPTVNDQPADVVLGQTSFTANTANQGLANPTAATLFEPYDGVYSNGLQLFVTDFSNNRTLIWNHFPTTNDTPADVVLGQPNATSNAHATTAVSEADPTGVLLVGQQLIVADRLNDRYLIYQGQ
ncbi:MAG TPA: hypothetical protein VFN52_01895 [Acidiferrobacteraceae bacterium]|nr:hypothetical protein [Acidiferrobacteraceae bacterium]